MLYIIFACCWNLVSVCLCDCVHRTMMPAPRCHCHWFALTSKPTTLVLLNVYIILLFSWPFASCRFSLFIFFRCYSVVIFILCRHASMHMCVYMNVLCLCIRSSYILIQNSLYIWNDDGDACSCGCVRCFGLDRLFMQSVIGVCLLCHLSLYVHCALVVMVTNWYIHFDFRNFVGWCGSDVTVILSSI